MFVFFRVGVLFSCIPLVSGCLQCKVILQGKLNPVFAAEGLGIDNGKVRHQTRQLLISLAGEYG